jgi:WD40 repeat protein
LASGHDYTELVVDRTRDFIGRDWVFAKLDGWIADPKSARIFFLGGGPGSGKSAVAARVVQIARGEASASAHADTCPHLAQAGLAYYHFCQAQYNAVIEPLGFVKSLSLALADRYPAFALALTQIGQRHPEIHVQQTVGQATASEITAVKIGTLEVGGLSARRAFAHLVAEPLAAVAHNGEAGIILILVDALDEALTFDQDDNIVTLLADVTDDPRDLPNQVRFLVTGRPDPRVVDLIGKPALDLVDDAPDSQHDVHAYAERRLASVVAEPAARRHLAARIAAAGAGNFLYARYVLNDFLRHPADPATLTLPAGLDEVYAGFLKREVGRQGRTWRIYRPLLGALVVARGSGLTRQQLAGIMDERPSAAEELLEPCMQYLGGAFPDGPFRIYHQSFRDFLLASSQYHLEPDEVRNAMARYFLAQYAAFQAKGAVLDDYTLANLPMHLAEAGRTADLHTLRFDYGWLQAKLDRLGVHALLADFSLGEPAADDVTRRLNRALEQAAHVLAQDPAQLAEQLLGRLLDDEDRTMQSLLGQARSQCRRPCLLPQTASLREVDALVRTLTGHMGRVTRVAVTPDGSRAVSASEDRTLKVWDLVRGVELHALMGHTRSVHSVALTPDGNQAVSASEDETLKVWDLASGRVLRTLTGHTGGVNGVAVTPDGSRAISASEDKTLKVWDLANGQELRTLTGHTDGVYTVVVTPDGSRAVSASGFFDRTLKVWDLASGVELRTLMGHTGSVHGVAVTADGSRVVSASADGSLKVWDLASGVELRTLTGHTSAVRDVAVTPDGSRAVSASEDRTLKIWDLASGVALYALTGHTHWVYGVAVTPDGKIAVSASWDYTLKVWDLANRGRPHNSTAHKDSVVGMAMTPDGSRAVSASADGSLKVWELASGMQLHVLIGHSKSVDGVAVTSDGSRAVSASSDYTLKVWGLTSGQELHTLAGHTSDVRGVAVSPDGRYAISASWDRTLKVWDLTSGRELRTLAGHTSEVYSVRVTPDGSRAVSGSAEGILKVWDLVRGVELHTLRGHSDSVQDIAVTPDGNCAVSASYDNTLKVWDLASGVALHTFTGHTGSVHGVAVTPDGSRAVSASYDRTLKVWDLASGQERYTLTGHRGPITLGVAVTPDGSRVISASWDGTLKVWNLASGACLASFHADSLLFVCAATHDGRTIVVAGRSGRVHFLRWEE